MSIKAESVDLIVKTGKELFEKRTLGGVTTESAAKAVENVARNVEDIGNKEIAKIRMQLNAEKGDLQKQLVEMTNQKDRVEFNLKNVTNERDRAVADLADVSEKIKAAIKTKVGKPKLNSNGNFEITKVNKNGARMTVEYANNEAKTPLSYVVEDVDRYVRRTKLNPATGKPVSTYTDTNGGHKYEYLPNGTKVTRVNAKKASEKPVKTSNQILEEKHDYAKIQQNYSDGSYEIINLNKSTNEVYKSTKFNVNGEKIGASELDNQMGYKTWVFNPKTGKAISSKREFINRDGEKYIEEKFFAEDGVTPILIKEVLPAYGGIKRIAKAVKNEFGIYLRDYNITYKYPKNSLIKTAKFKNNYSGHSDVMCPEVLKLKDGRNVELSVNDWYEPIRAKIITKGKESVEINGNELREFLDKIGYRKGMNPEVYAWPNPS